MYDAADARNVAVCYHDNGATPMYSIWVFIFICSLGR